MRLLASLILIGWATASAVAQSVPGGIPVEGPPSAGIWFASFEGAEALVVDGQHFPGPRAVLPVDDPAAVRAIGASVAPSVRWREAPAPLFFDAERVSQAALSSEDLTKTTLWLEVWNATGESVPLLFVVTGGTGPFARTRAPLTTAILPWSCVRVPVPFAWKDGVKVPEEGSLPLYVSVGGTPGIEPTVQFVDLLMVGDAIGPKLPIPVQPRVPLLPMAGLSLRVEQSFLGGPPADQDVRAEQMGQSLELALPDSLRLLRIDLSPAIDVEQLKIVGMEQTFQRAQLGHRFWLKREHERAPWQAGLYPPPARYKHFERPGGLAHAMAQEAVFLIGNGGGDATVAARIERARLESQRWLARTGRSPMILFEDQYSRALSFTDFKDRLLVLFGNEDDLPSWSALVGNPFALRCRAHGLGFGNDASLEAATAIAAAPRADDPHAGLLLMADSGAASLARPFDLLLPADPGDADSILLRDGLRVTGRFDHRWLLPGTAEAGEEKR